MILSPFLNLFFKYILIKILFVPGTLLDAGDTKVGIAWLPGFEGFSV